ncbi:tetratricopeptide repeat protein [Mesorhizobium sp. M2D.F.Ca.ET.185.01.1.1]|uniref:tetratricopeptide repeat protein n=1 Tax=unclassified Mesorhizobium TaxID=325217 RepID=UPI000FC9E8DD|nr:MULTISPECIES: tetratricopeptide repeat protein [unclassified Mesorhizobium]TGP82347.1 tetratricopeptide repeat protein [bacterium M00.F.Ca.ET.227.01.1.1]TGP92245.1 tetratricopeptide repeat protein [bacterium M00.F.Ca.ET.221.01.1.1]TGP95442.1 tetratricopeptide repeat protein [bacterium M00.F.Ca.ET.222.01.1.1]TGU09917.1 tetratricopeptide repeat protein [bacterium M00.F.Ca.ET.163.01.1.1]TGU39111.1 tetratricopeptide repeat protein [bacterium M00.F.Ca.ET.156.01.1.1]TGU48030.1 tetratricopeptide 
MMMKDAFGLNYSGATEVGFSSYVKAVHELQCFIGDPVGSIDRAIADDPAFVMAHVFKGYLFGLATERDASAVARSSYEAALPLAASAREAAHVAALGHLAEGRWHEAARILEDIAVDFPLDALALQTGHQIDFFTGNARMLRDRIGRALPAWQKDMPGYHAILGMQAFGLEEMGDYARAESFGRQAVEIEPRDGWAQHAVAHVMEMQSRQREGIAWMRANPEAWTKESFLQIHNWWHLALFHYDLGETGEVLRLYDGPIYGKRSTLALNMVDASAILWRLHLGGVDVGDRWAALAANWIPKAAAGNYAFNDAHAMMAFVGAGLEAPAKTLIEVQREAMRGTDDNAAFTRDVGHPLTLAIQAFGQGNYDETARLIRPIRSIAHRFGGSHAQRDVIDLTLLEAALRADDKALARALTAERQLARPDSPLSALFLRRASDLSEN